MHASAVDGGAVGPGRGRHLLLATLHARPTGLDVGAIVLVAVFTRLLFAPSAPPFLNLDSEGYYLPAHDLLAGLPFDPGLRRTPTYPLFIATIIAIVGEDLQRLVSVQHFVLGPPTALLTYTLGRLLTIRLVALAAGLLTAISGPMLLYEHYVMTEAPFALLLVATLVALALAIQRTSWRWTVAAGLLFGATILCRPSGQMLLPLFGLAIALGRRSWQRRLIAMAIFGLATAVVVVPWMLVNYSRHDTFAVAGSGRFLLARTIKEDPGGFTFEAPPGLVENETRARARRIVQRESERRPPGSSAQRLREDLGLSEAEAYRIMGDLALEAIRRRPAYFVEGGARFFVTVLVGRPLDVRREGLEWDEVDWERRVRHVLQRPISRLDVQRAQTLLSLYAPAQLGPIVPILFMAGLAFAASGLAPRGLLLPGLAALVMIGGSATLVGGEVRYRYPQDPLIALLAVQALATVSGLLVARLSRPRPSLEPAELATATSPTRQDPA